MQTSMLKNEDNKELMNQLFCKLSVEERAQTISMHNLEARLYLKEAEKIEVEMYQKIGASVDAFTSRKNFIPNIMEGQYNGFNSHPFFEKERENYLEVILNPLKEGGFLTVEDCKFFPKVDNTVCFRKDVTKVSRPPDKSIISNEAVNGCFSPAGDSSLPCEH